MLERRIGNVGPQYGVMRENSRVKKWDQIWTGKEICPPGYGAKQVCDLRLSLATGSDSLSPRNSSSSLSKLNGTTPWIRGWLIKVWKIKRLLHCILVGEGGVKGSHELQNENLTYLLGSLQRGRMSRHIMVLANTLQASAANSFQTLIYHQQTGGSQPTVIARDSQSMSCFLSQQIL